MTSPRTVTCGDVDPRTGRVVRCMRCQWYTEHEPPAEYQAVVEVR